MGNKLLPLLVVLLCFTSYAYSAANFQASVSGNLTSYSTTTTITVTPPTITTPVSVTVTANNVVTLSQNVNIFIDNTPWYFTATSNVPGIATLTFTLNDNTDYSAPAPLTIYNFLSVSYGGSEFYPGNKVTGQVSLSASPADSVTFTFAASSSVVFTPTSFKFNANQPPYTLPYSATSTEPGTYYVYAVASGPDAAFVSTPTPNASFVVDLRLVRTNPANNFQTKVGIQTSPILVYLDVAPDSDLTVSIDTFSSDIVANPASLSFTSTVTALSYTLVGSSPDYETIAYNLTGTDKNKYSVQSTPTISVSNRTISISSAPSVLIGVASTPVSMYVADPPSSPLVVTFSSPDGDVSFSPSSCSFDAAHAVCTFSYTASNVSNPTTRTINFALSGVLASYFTVPGPIYAAISGTKRTVTPDYSFDPTRFPFGSSVSAVLDLDLIPPTSFYVDITATYATITPPRITFSNSTGGLEQSFSIESDTLGSDRIYFTIGGTDAALVNTIGSIAITVSQYSAPYLAIDTATVGVPLTCTLTLPSPVIDGLTITLSSSPASSAITLDPNVFILTSPGLDAGVVSYTFSLTASDVGTFVIHASLSGPDVDLFPAPADVIVDVASVSFDVTVFTISGSPVVNVPITGLAVKLDQPHASTVTLTPSAATLIFQPVTFVFPPDTSEICVTVTPQVAPLAQETIVFTSSDPTNYVAPNPITFGPIVQRSFNLGSLAGTVNLVVGVPSAAFTVTVNYPGDVVLTPQSTDGLVFLPTTLAFTDDVNVLYITITATSLNNRNPVVTWSTSGADSSSYATPSLLNQLFVAGRSLSLPSGSFDNTLVGVESLPVVVSSEYAVVSGLTIAPSAQDVTFSPPYVTLQPGDSFAAFTAEYPVWTSANSFLSAPVQFVLSGPDAPWYNPLATYFYSYKRSVTLSTYNFLTYTNYPGFPVTITLEEPPETDVSVSFCAPGWLSFDPPQLDFAAGQQTNTVVISAAPLLDTPPPETITVALDLLGTDANSYNEPGDISVTVISDASLSLNGFPDSVTLGNVPVPFEIFTDFVEFEPFTVTFVSQGSLTFVPASVQLAPNNIHFFVTVQATGILHNNVQTSPEVVTFEIAGNDGVLGSLGQRTVSVLKRSFSAQVENSGVTVGTPTTGWVSIDYPPFVDQIVLTPFSSPVLTFTPATLVFDANTTVAYFVVSVPTADSYALTWEVTGTEAAFYGPPPSISFSGYLRNIYFYTSELIISAGRLNAAWFYLTTPVTDDLTITSVAPSPLVVTPASITLNAGDNQGYFVVTTNGNLYTGDDNLISFVLSGTDDAWYSPPSSLQIAIQTSAISVSEITEVDVGTPTNPVYVTLGISTVNGVTVTPVGEGVIFDPPTLQFVPGQSAAVLVITPVRVGAIPILFSVSGPDAWLYNEFTSVVYSDLRYIGLYLDYPSVGFPTIEELFVYTPPATSLTFTPISTGLNFDSSSYTLSPTEAAVEFFYSPNKCGYVDVDWVVSGDDVAWYQLADVQSSSFYIPCIGITITAPLTVMPNVPSGGYAIIDFPASVSVVVSAPGCTFTPSTFDFDANTLSVAFTFICDVPAPEIASTIPITYIVSGTDVDLLQEPIVSDDITIMPNMLNTPSSLDDVYSGQTTSYEVYLSYPAYDDVTVTPWASNAIFAPASFTFSAGDAGAVFFEVTPTSPVQVVVQYTLSGRGSPSVGVSGPTYFNVDYGYLAWGFSGTTVGEDTGPYVVFINPPCPNDVTFTPSAPGCTFTPSAIAFTHLTTTQSVSLVCASVGQPVISMVISGTDAAHYAVPGANQIAINPRLLNPSVETADPQIFDLHYGYIQLYTPTDNGLTVTPVSTLLTFSPSSIVLPPGASYFPFSFSAVELGHDVIEWVLSGADAGWYTQPDPTFVDIAPRQVIPYVPNFGTIYAGVSSDTFSVVLDRAPESGLIVTPYGAGLTFSPAQLIFAPGETGISFTVQASANGYLPIYWDLSGDDEDYFAIPAPIYISTSLLSLQLDTDSYYNPIVGDASPPLLLYTNWPPSDTVTLTLVGPGTFDPPTLTLSPTAPAGTFVFTPAGVGYAVITAEVSGNAAAQFFGPVSTSPFFVSQRLIRTPYQIPDLYANVPSAWLSVSVDDAPPTGFVLTPTAPNTVFSPSSLQFSPTVTHVEFFLTTASPTEYNTYPSQEGNLAPTRVTWTLSGTDAGWYTPLATAQFSVLPRDVNIYYADSSQYVAVPFTVVVDTTYPPNGTLTLTPVGQFSFSPPSVSLTSTETSATFTVTPIAPGDSMSFMFVYSDSDADLYELTGWQSVSVEQWYFILPNLQNTYQFGLWSAPLIVRTNYVPDEDVSLTISSDYLYFNPSTLTIGPAATSAQVQLLLKPGLDYLRTVDFTVHFWVSGPAAYLFSTPSPQTIYWPVGFPPRSITVFNFPESIYVGVTSAPIIVRIPNYPLGSLTITPVPYSPHVTFDPTSVTLSRTSTALTAAFTVVVNHPLVTGVVEFALSGSDAAFYAPPSYEIGAVYERYVSFSTQSLTVGTTSQPFTVSTMYPVPNGLSVSLSSESVAFDPPVLNFSPNVSVVAFTATGGTVGSSIPVTVSTWGPDVDWFNPAFTAFPVTLNVNPRNWASSPSGGSYYLSAGIPITIDYSVNDPPLSSLTITPYAAGISFFPETFILYPNMSSVTFAVLGVVGGTAVSVTTVLGGDDYLLYTPISLYTVYVSLLSLQADNLPNGETAVDLGDERDVRIVCSNPPVNGIWVTPAARGLVFTPPSVYIPPGHAYAHVSYLARWVGLSTVKFSVSGDDALLYDVIQPSGTIRVYPLTLQTTSPAALTVGATSPAIALYFRGAGTNAQRAAFEDVYVDFLVSPPGAVAISPPNFTITGATSSFQIQVTPAIPSDKLVITPILSGPGEKYFRILPGSTPNPITFTSNRRTFTLTDFFNYFANPNQRQLVVGIETEPFGVTANSVPSDVALYLNAPGLQFIPSVLLFTGTYETLYFTILPLRPILTQITFSVGGTSANWFAVPSVSPQIRVTHDFVIPSLPSIFIGQEAPAQTIDIISPFPSTVVLTPSVPSCPSGGPPPPFVNFLPPFLIFTPNSTTQSFTYFGNCATNNIGSNFNPVRTEGAFSTSPATVPVTWRITEAGETTPYTLSFPTLSGVLGVNVLQATFDVQIGRLIIGKTANITISVTQTPRSDVVLTLVANNLNINPPHVTFFPNVASVTIQATPVHSDFKDSNVIPFNLDYIVSGTNWADYVPPAQTFFGVVRGDADVAGGICGSDGVSVSVGGWIAVFVVFVLLLQ